MRSERDARLRETPASVTIIEPRVSPGLRLMEIIEHADLLRILALRDIQLRYKQTVLGAAWALLQPILTMLVLAAIFGRQLGLIDLLPGSYVEACRSPLQAYALFVYCGVLPWTLFSALVNGSSMSLLANTSLLTKVYFPRILIPLSHLGYSLLDLSVALLLLIPLLSWGQITPGPNIILLPISVLIVILSALGLGILLTALIVQYRDVRFALPFLLQLLFFLTPVFYPDTIYPATWGWLLAWNPLVGALDAFRASFLPIDPDPILIVKGVLLSLALFILGVWYFRRVELRFADIV